MLEMFNTLSACNFPLIFFLFLVIFSMIPQRGIFLSLYFISIFVSMFIVANSIDFLFTDIEFSKIMLLSFILFAFIYALAIILSKIAGTIDTFLRSSADYYQSCKIVSSKTIRHFLYGLQSIILFSFVYSFLFCSYPVLPKIFPELQAFNEFVKKNSQSLHSLNELKDIFVTTPEYMEMVKSRERQEITTIVDETKKSRGK